MMDADERLRGLLGGDELRDLRQRLRARYERGTQAEVFTLGGLTEVERAALENLLGRPLRRAGSMRVRLAEIDTVLSRAGLARDLRAALELLDGPIVEQARLRREREAAWNAVYDGIDHGLLAASLTRPESFGLLKRLADGDPDVARMLLAQALRVIEPQPPDGTPLSVLAAERLGDAHALDAGSKVARLVLNAIAPVTGEDESEESDRRRWARIGVRLGVLNRPVLVLNLPAVADTSAGALSEVGRAHGEPLHVSLHLLRAASRWQVAGREVFVCENPDIVLLAAIHLGKDCAPLVCTDGNPAAAQATLLAQLRDAGACLRYHGDFDWDGIRIGNRMMREFGASPWRFSASDYRPCGTRLLEGAPCAANWDVLLAPAMHAAGTAVHEESAADVLLADLTASPTSRLNG